MDLSKVDLVAAKQIKTAQQFEQTDRKNDKIVNVLKQACSRNKAIEKKDLWEAKHRQDHGSKSCISLKSNTGEVHELAKVPANAEVTINSINKYEEDRRRHASMKEDSQLGRFCDGQDTAWRPDSFFTEVCGDEDVPPWPIRPAELFTNPHLHFRIRAMEMEKRKLKKQARKEARRLLSGEALQDQGLEPQGEESEQGEKRKRKEKESKKEKKAKKAKKDKKDKKGKKDKKAKKKKEKEKKSKKEKKEKKDKQEEKDKHGNAQGREEDKAKQKGTGDQRDGGAAGQPSDEKGRGACEDQGKEESDADGDGPFLVLKSSEEVAQERKIRAEEKEPSAVEQAQDASSEDESSEEEEEQENDGPMHEVASSSEADWG